jgi:hypothetical protein
MAMVVHLPLIHLSGLLAYGGPDIEMQRVVQRESAANQ